MSLNKRIILSGGVSYDVGFTTFGSKADYSVGVNNGTEKYIEWTSATRVVVCDTAGIANHYILQAYTWNGSSFSTQGSSSTYNHSHTHGSPITKNVATGKIVALNHPNGTFAEYADNGSSFGSQTTFTAPSGGAYSGVDLSYHTVPDVGTHIYQMVGTSTVRRTNPSNYSDFTDITLPETLDSANSGGSYKSIAYDGFGFWIIYYNNSRTWFAKKYSPDWAAVLVAEQTIYGTTPYNEKEPGSCQFIHDGTNTMWVKSQMRDLISKYTLT